MGQKNIVISDFHYMITVTNKIHDNDIIVNEKKLVTKNNKNAIRNINLYLCLLFVLSLFFGNE